MSNTILRQTKIAEHQAFQAMFVARKEVFIDLLKWDLPILDDRFEVDQFDTSDAQYLILLDSDGRHRASARLLPTTKPHLLGTLFPYLCAGPVPAGPTILEITRFCLDRHQSTRLRREARNTLVSALALHALKTGITAYTGVAEVGWFEQIGRFGWRCTRLGQPVQRSNQCLTSLRVDIDADTLPALKANHICTNDTLRLFSM